MEWYCVGDIVPRLPFVFASSLVEDIVLAIYAKNAILENALPVLLLVFVTTLYLPFVNWDRLPLVLDTLYLVVHTEHDLAAIFVFVVLLEIIVRVVEI